MFAFDTINAQTYHAFPDSNAVWQDEYCGYYGNITGTITLDDALNETLYNWQLIAPQGEVYAANFSSVTWSGVYCVNVSGIRPNNGTQAGAVVYSTNYSEVEKRFGINETDKDGLNETFNDTYSSSFQTGTVAFTGSSGCSVVHPYVNEAYATSWNEVLLSDNTSIIFTAVVRNDASNFQAGSSTSDFEMMVLQNGHAEASGSTSPYYFFVELS